MRSSLDILSISNSAVEVHEIFKCPIRTTIKSQTSMKFGQIGLRAAELAIIDFVA